MRLIILAAMLTIPAVAQTSIAAGAPGQNPPITATVQWLAKTVVSSLVCPATLESGTTGTCTVTLNQAAPSDKTITLNSADTTKITVPASMVIKAGDTQGTFVITAL